MVRNFLPNLRLAVLIKKRAYLDFQQVHPLPHIRVPTGCYGNIPNISEVLVTKPIVFIIGRKLYFIFKIFSFYKRLLRHCRRFKYARALLYWKDQILSKIMADLRWIGKLEDFSPKILTIFLWN